MSSLKSRALLKFYYKELLCTLCFISLGCFGLYQKSNLGRLVSSKTGEHFLLKTLLKKKIQIETVERYFMGLQGVSRIEIVNKENLLPKETIAKSLELGLPRYSLLNVYLSTPYEKEAKKIELLLKKQWGDSLVSSEIEEWGEAYTKEERIVVVLGLVILLFGVISLFLLLKKVVLLKSERRFFLNKKNVFAALLFISFLSEDAIGLDRHEEFSKNNKMISSLNNNLIKSQARSLSLNAEIRNKSTEVKYAHRLMEDSLLYSQSLSKEIETQAAEIRNEKKLLSRLFESFYFSTEELLAEELKKQIEEKVSKLSAKQKRVDALKKDLKESKEKLSQIESSVLALERELTQVLVKSENSEEELNNYAKTKEQLKNRQAYLSSRLTPKKKKEQKKHLLTLLTPVIPKGYKKRDQGFEFRSKGAYIRSIRPGKVKYYGSLGVYGKALIIEHHDGLKSVYLGEFSGLIQSGQKVKANENIAKFKKSSNRELYFEMRKGKSFVDDIAWESRHL